MNEDIQLVTLYGEGAVILQNGKTTFRAADGRLQVPPSLVRQAEQAGYSRTRSGKSEIASGAKAPEPTPPIVEEIPTLTPAQLRKLPEDERRTVYQAEVEEAGYSPEATAKIVGERIEFDKLVLSGKTEEEAAAIIWGGGSESATSDGQPAGEIAAPTPNADVTALSADAAASDTEKVE